MDPDAQALGNSRVQQPYGRSEFHNADSSRLPPVRVRNTKNLPPPPPPSGAVIPPGFEPIWNCLFVSHDKSGEPVIYEVAYQNNQKRFKALTYPQEKNRWYYKEGDFILHGEVSRSKLSEAMPEMKQKSWLTLLLLLFGKEQTAFKTASRIDKIELRPSPVGTGNVYLTRVVWISEEFPPVLYQPDTKPGVPSKVNKVRYEEFSETIALAKAFDSTVEWGELIVKFSTTMVSTVLGGVLKSAAKTAAITVIKQQVKKEVIDRLKKAGPQMAAAAITAMIQEFASVTLEHLSKKKVYAANVGPMKITDVPIDKQFLTFALEKAAVAGSRAFFLKGLEIVFGDVLEQLFPSETHQDFIGKASDKIKKLIWEKVLNLAPATIDLCLSAVAEEAIGSYDDNGNFKKGDFQSLGAKIKTRFREIYKLETPSDFISKLEGVFGLAADATSEQLFD